MSGSIFPRNLDSLYPKLPTSGEGCHGFSHETYHGIAEAGPSPLEKEYVLAQHANPKEKEASVGASNDINSC